MFYSRMFLPDFIDSGYLIKARARAFRTAKTVRMNSYIEFWWMRQQSEGSFIL